MKEINVAKRFYEEKYTRSLGFSARSSWEIWKNSWAGQLWVQKHSEEISRIYETDKKRFGWCTKYVLGI